MKTSYYDLPLYYSACVMKAIPLRNDMIMGLLEVFKHPCHNPYLAVKQTSSELPVLREQE